MNWVIVVMRRAMNCPTTNASDSQRAMYNSFRNYPIKYLNFICKGYYSITYVEKSRGV